MPLIYPHRFQAANKPGMVFVRPCLNVGTTMPPVLPGMRCMLRSTNGEAIESVFPVRRPATMTVVLAPMYWASSWGLLKYTRFSCSLASMSHSFILLVASLKILRKLVRKLKYYVCGSSLGSSKISSKFRSASSASMFSVSG